MVETSISTDAISDQNLPSHQVAMKPKYDIEIQHMNHEVADSGVEDPSESLAPVLEAACLGLKKREVRPS